MRKKILITPKSFIQARDKAYEIFSKYDLDIIENKTGKTLTKQQMLDLCSDADGVIVGIDPMDEEILRNAKRLKAISKYGVGLDNIDLKAAEEDALYEALQKGIIAGAAQDVFSKEPPSEHNKLLSLGNFILTPHMGAYTREATERMVMISANNLIEMLY